MEHLPGENPNEKEKPPEQQLADFRAEIDEIKNGGEFEGRITSSLSAESFNPNDLTKEDMTVWKMVRSGDITEEILDAYQTSILKGADARTQSKIPGDSRNVFYAFVANIAGGILARRELSAERERNKT